MQTRGSTVTNGEVVGFTDGVAISGGSGNRVVRLSLHDNIGRDNGDGVAMFGSDRNPDSRTPDTAPGIGARGHRSLTL